MEMHTPKSFGQECIALSTELLNDMKGFFFFFLVVVVAIVGTSNPKSSEVTASRICKGEPSQLVYMA